MMTPNVGDGRDIHPCQGEKELRSIAVHLEYSRLGGVGLLQQSCRKLSRFVRLSKALLETKPTSAGYKYLWHEAVEGDLTLRN